MDHHPLCDIRRVEVRAVARVRCRPCNNHRSDLLRLFQCRRPTPGHLHEVRILMGALANATSLRHDTDFIGWVESAIVYQSRLVLTGDTAAPGGTTAAQLAVRLKLAKSTAVSPRQILDLCVCAIACDPDVANLGGTAAIVGEALVLSKMAAIWTTVAQLT